MRIKRKILIATATIFTIVLSSRAYILYNLSKQEKEINADLDRIQQINNYTYELGTLQHKIETEELTYQLDKNPQHLQTVEDAKAKRLATLDKINPLVKSETRKKLIEAYTKGFSNEDFEALDSYNIGSLNVTKRHITEIRTSVSKLILAATALLLVASG